MVLATNFQFIIYNKLILNEPYGEQATKFQISNYKRNKGFTLIELIVVMAVFLLIMATAMAIFISIVSHQRIILARQELLNQTSYFIEYMTKGLRMAGKDWVGDCIKDDQGNPGYVYQLTRYDNQLGIWKGIKFVNQSDNNVCQEFYLDDAQSPVIREIKNGEPSVPVSSTNLNINSLSFSVNGYEPGNQDCKFAPSADCGEGQQPRVTVSLDVKIQGDDNQPSTKAQTTVSQRDLNK